MIRIALDAMGSDNAPRVEVEGAAQALQDLPPEFRRGIYAQPHTFRAWVRFSVPVRILRRISTILAS